MVESVKNVCDFLKKMCIVLRAEYLTIFQRVHYIVNTRAASATSSSLSAVMGLPKEGLLKSVMAHNPDAGQNPQISVCLLTDNNVELLVRFQLKSHFTHNGTALLNNPTS